MTDVNFGYGQMTPEQPASEAGMIQFIVKQMLAQVRTVVWVQVKAVSGGGLSATATVDVTPLVSMIDGLGNPTPHGTLYGIPVLRFQGGNGALVIDPAVGDVGLLLVADRDASAIKAQAPNFEQLPPQTVRQFDLMDGAYLGSLFGATPSQYFEVTASGITIKDTNGNTITMNSTGFDVKDAANNEIVSTATGMTIKGANGSQIQMLPGNIVNVVCTAFEVNGVPVTVP